MTDRATGDRDPFGLWLEASRSFFGAPASESVSEPLRERCEALFGAWARFAETYAAASGGGDAASGATGGATGTGAAGGPFEPLTWMDAASGGGFGDLWRWFGAGQHGGAGGWQAERDAILASREWGAYALALGRYQAAMAEGWLAAFRRFSDGLAREHADGEPPPWETIRARWQEAADHELAETMRSEAFLSAQRDLIRSRLDCAALVRRRLEGIAEAFGLPTRSEVDDLAERVQHLSREVWALKAEAATKAPAKKTPKGSAKGTAKGSAKETPKRTAKGSAKGTPKAPSKGTAGKASGRKAKG